MAIISIIAVSSCKKDEEKTIIIDFEELDPGTDGFWNGSGGEGGFVSGMAFFPNNYISGEYSSWSGFSFTNHTDTKTEDWTNMYSAIPGSGEDLSEMYSTYYYSSYSGLPDTILFEEPVMVKSISVANTTYAYYSMLNGDIYAKKFGGEDGNDPDWFRLVITALDNHARSVTTYNIYLADFRNENNTLDYISNVWNKIDMSASGFISGLTFMIESSDTGVNGVNTPTYVSIDNIELKLE